VARQFNHLWPRRRPLKLVDHHLDTTAGTNHNGPHVAVCQPFHPRGTSALLHTLYGDRHWNPKMKQKIGQWKVIYAPTCIRLIDRLLRVTKDSCCSTVENPFVQDPDISQGEPSGQDMSLDQRVYERCECRPPIDLGVG